MLANALTDCNTRDMMHFDDGRLVHRIDLTGDVYWRDDRLVIGHTLPETLLIGMTGRPLAAVAQHPLLCEDSVIRTARATRTRTTVTTNTPTVPLTDVIEALLPRIPKELGRRLRESAL